jgi:hypothetical protein
MRCLPFILVLASAFSAGAQPVQLPKDGNGLLDYCNHVVELMDNPTSQTNPDDPVKFADNMMKFGWCSGYIQAMRENIDGWQLKFVVQFVPNDGQKKPQPARLYADEDYYAITIPPEVSVGQIARVLVKWLRDHPERLHEPPPILTIDAIKNAFPSQPVVKPN